MSSMKIGNDRLRLDMNKKPFAILEQLRMNRTDKEKLAILGIMKIHAQYHSTQPSNTEGDKK